MTTLAGRVEGQAEGRVEGAPAVTVAFLGPALGAPPGPTIPLRLCAERPENPEPGDVWRYPPGDIPDRACWWVALPNLRDDVEVSWRTTDRASSPPHDLWDVSGEPPLLTVSPSIDVEHWTPAGVRDGSYWHGHISNGAITA